MDTYEVLLNLPGPDRFLVILSFLLLITLLTYRNMIDRSRAEKRLRQRLDQLTDEIDSREQRLREMHHRVKNHMQQISSMLGLQAVRCPDPDATARIKKCQSRVHSIAMIHELLDDAGTEEELDVKPYLERLVDRSKEFLNGGASEVEVHTNIDRMTVDAETATSCGLVVSELMTNCFKHAFDTSEDAGCIDVRCERSNGHIELSVTDNGTGFRESELQPKDSIGHEIVQSVVESDLDGHLDLKNTGNGASVDITFPAPEQTVRRN